MFTLQESLDNYNSVMRKAKFAFPLGFEITISSLA